MSGGMNKKARQTIFLVFAGFCLVAAGHHLYEYIYQSVRPDYPRNRHLIFILINLVLAIVLVNRTKLGLVFLILLGVQQLYGHGSQFIAALHMGGTPHYTDWIPILLIPLVVGLYIYDLRYRTLDTLL